MSFRRPRLVFIVLSIALGLPYTAAAQTTGVTGTVIDSATAAPLFCRAAAAHELRGRDRVERAE
jgi:hypothetical protein